MQHRFNKNIYSNPRFVTINFGFYFIVSTVHKTCVLGDVTAQKDLFSLKDKVYLIQDFSLHISLARVAADFSLPRKLAIFFLEKLCHLHKCVNTDW